MNITRRQRDTLNFIETFTLDKGYAPSYDEIREALGLSSLATVHKHIHNLKERGWLRVDEHRSRSLELIPQQARPRFIQKGPDHLLDTVLNCWWVKEKK